MLLLSIFSTTGGSLRAADFIRGDVNGDGMVNLADLHALTRAMYIDEVTQWWAVHPLPCLNAADVNDDGEIMIQDVWMLTDRVHLGSLPPPPFPAIGPDPTPNPPGRFGSPPLDCESYGGGSAIDDPAARLDVDEVVFEGGEEAKATITLSLSNSTPVHGFVADLLIAGDILMGVQRTTTREDNPSGHMSFATLLDSGAVRVEAYKKYDNDSPLAAGAGVPVVRVTVCLREGVGAGDYPITIQSAELVDFASNRSIYPALEAGSLTVASPVTTGLTDCLSTPNPPVHAVFQIGSTKGKRGSQVTVPIVARAEIDIVGYILSLDFDEEVLEDASLEFVWQRPDGQPFFYEKKEVNNDNRVPGSGGVDEGFAIAAVIIPTGQPTGAPDEEPDAAMPADTDNVVALFHATIRPDATASSARLRFLDGGRGKTTEPLGNIFTLYDYDQGKYYTLREVQASSFILVDGRVNVLPDIAIFVRGDANGDGDLDITDPVTTLAFLYQGGAAPDCLKAADVNDDSLVDITDPIASLNYLFLDGDAPPAPYPAAGLDPTDDSLRCYE
jgi:hypothetical protein